MKATEFCYWLQGGFELASIGVFDELQLEIIRKHLALVRATDQDGQPVEAIEFCSWLRGGVDFIRQGDGQQAATVRLRLSSVFEHAIDPTYSNTGDLNAIHNGQTKPPRIPHAPGMRC